MEISDCGWMPQAVESLRAHPHTDTGHSGTLSPTPPTRTGGGTGTNGGCCRKIRPSSDDPTPESSRHERGAQVEAITGKFKSRLVPAQAGVPLKATAEVSRSRSIPAQAGGRVKAVAEVLGPEVVPERSGNTMGGPFRYGEPAAHSGKGAKHHTPPPQIYRTPHSCPHEKNEYPLHPPRETTPTQAKNICRIKTIHSLQSVCLHAGGKHDAPPTDKQITADKKTQEFRSRAKTRTPTDLQTGRKSSLTKKHKNSDHVQNTKRPIGVIGTTSSSTEKHKNSDHVQNTKNRSESSKFPYFNSSCRARPDAPAHMSSSRAPSVTTCSSADDERDGECEGRIQITTSRSDRCP